MAWNTLTDLQYGSLVTEGDMDAIRENIEHLGALLTGADVALSSKAVGASIGAAVATGSYSGSGTNPQAISGLGFTPRFVMIGMTWTGGVTPLKAWKVASTLVEMIESAYGVDTSGTRIASFDSDGFTVTADNHVNKSGETYYYLALE